MDEAVTTKKMFELRDNKLVGIYLLPFIFSQWANHLGPKSKKRSFDAADIWGVFNSL